MSSSSRGRIVRGAAGAQPDATPVAAALDRDLSKLSMRLFDPERIAAAQEDGYRDGFAAGHAEGLAVGAADGRAAAVVELEGARRQLGAVLVALRDQLHLVAQQEQALLAATEQAIVEAALLLAEAVLGRELAVAEDPGRDAIARALSLAPTGAATARAYLHPTDLEALGPLDALALGTTIEVVADHDVEPGGCLLEIGDCSIDAQLGPALRRAAAALHGSPEASAP